MIRQLQRSELKVVQDLAYEIWPLVYSEMISREQMKYMLDWMYHLDVLTAKIDNGDLFFSYSLENNDIGYLHLELVDEKTIKVQKIYVHPDFHGRGIGRELIQTAIDMATAQGRSSLELQVNRANPAVRFYKQLGFSITGEKDFDIGNGYFMNDYVMRFIIR
ncbi:MAG: hypothetical protein RIQ47_1582 [Bacteroidota bacterium]|jgi:ribosomal protein S18 acetylase RimI-like enzyme